MIKDLNVRPETIQLLEENMGKTLSGINHSKIFIDPPPRKKFLHSKGNHKPDKKNNPQNGRKYLQTNQLTRD